MVKFWVRQAHIIRCLLGVLVQSSLLASLLRPLYNQCGLGILQSSVISIEKYYPFKLPKPAAAWSIYYFLNCGSNTWKTHNGQIWIRWMHIIRFLLGVLVPSSHCSILNETPLQSMWVRNFSERCNFNTKNHTTQAQSIQNGDKCTA